MPFVIPSVTLHQKIDMVYFPNAKINIGLQVTGKRADGFHELISCFYPVPWIDIIEVIEEKTLRFSCSGLPIPGNVEDNLCLRAYALLNRDFKLPPVHIHLHKNIPIGAGLGGGSSDAAFTLKAINQVFQLNLDLDRLSHYAATLGSDCTFFILNQPAMATGRGEALQPLHLDLSDKYIVMIFPNIHIGTAEAYGSLSPKPAAYRLQEVLESMPLSHWKSRVSNDFEQALFTRYPTLRQCKDSLYGAGAEYTAMTGSGSTIYGIFDGKVKLEHLFPKDYTVWSGFL